MTCLSRATPSRCVPTTARYASLPSRAQRSGGVRVNLSLTHASPLPHTPRLLSCLVAALALAGVAPAQTAPPIAEEVATQITPVEPPPDGAGDLLKIALTVKARATRRVLDSVRVDIGDEFAGRLIGSARTDAQGRVEFVVPFRGSYRIETCRAGFLAAGAEVLDCAVEPIHLCIDGFDFVTYENAVDSLRSDHVLRTELHLDRLGVGEVVALDRILYDYGEPTLRPYSRRELDRLATLLRGQPSLAIEVQSHTDARGSMEGNLLLSEERARTVVDYLVGEGVDSAQVTARGFGESRLANDCTDGVECDERAHQANRRTEFEIRAIDSLACGEPIR